MQLNDTIKLQEDRVRYPVLLKYDDNLVGNEFSKDLDENIENLQLLIEEAKKKC